MSHPLQATIDELWERRTELTTQSTDAIKIIESVIGDLDSGKLRVAEKINGEWVVNQWAKKAGAAVLPHPRQPRPEGRRTSTSMTGRTPSFQGWTEEQFKAGGFRVVPGAFARKGSFIAKNCVLMPSYVNIGAHVDEGTMVDTWATVGSCAQIGKNVHLSGGVGIGGVLEPIQAGPYIEDNCFIGPRSEVVEGVSSARTRVISMGVNTARAPRSTTAKPANHLRRIPPAPS
jgi:2,3,4,5-tetrahydropyridine-2-carboxylate N-succinyltransferase